MSWQLYWSISLCPETLTMVLNWNCASAKATLPEHLSVHRTPRCVFAICTVSTTELDKQDEWTACSTATLKTHTFNCFGPEYYLYILIHVDPRTLIFQPACWYTYSAEIYCYALVQDKTLKTEWRHDGVHSPLCPFFNMTTNPSAHCVPSRPIVPLSHVLH